MAIIRNSTRRLSKLMTALNAWVAIGTFGFAHAGDLTVELSTKSGNLESIGCAIFDQSEGFPLERDKAIIERPTSILGDKAIASFSDLAPGTYAFSCFQDVNGNGKLDRNFVGSPKEPWVASQDVRPRLRAPRFSEAGFEVPAVGEVRFELIVR